MSFHDDALLPSFAGFLLALCIARSHAPAGCAPEILARAPEPLASARTLAPDRMCLRDLRRLPAIGPARALAIVRARFEDGLTGGPSAWERIPGIGTETVRAARAWIAAAETGARAGAAGGGEAPAARGAPVAPRASPDPHALSGPGAGAYTPLGRRP